MQPFIWETYEYHHTPKTADWFWALGIVALCCVFIAILTGNVLFGIVIILAAFSLSLYAARKPKKIRVEINSKGVRVDDTIFPFAHIHSFALSVDGRHPSLVITMDKLLMPHILIPLADVEPEDVRTILSARLKEDHYEEPLSQKIFEAFGL